IRTSTGQGGISLETGIGQWPGRRGLLFLYDSLPADNAPRSVGARLRRVGNPADVANVLADCVGAPPAKVAGAEAGGGRDLRTGQGEIARLRMGAGYDCADSGRRRSPGDTHARLGVEGRVGFAS